MDQTELIPQSKDELNVKEIIFWSSMAMYLYGTERGIWGS